MIRTILRPSSATPSPTPIDRIGLFPTGSGNPNPTDLPPGSTPAPTPNIDNNIPQGDMEVYNGPLFRMQYPKNWGILTCNNSRNIELDPSAGADQLNMACDYAVKPVTIIVGQNTCSGGQEVNLGNIRVRKVVGPIATNTGGSGTQYHWCTQTPVPLDITHRVGSGRAFSATDYAPQIEQSIASLQFTQ